MIEPKLIDLPTSIRGLTKQNPDGSYTILINARMNDETQRKAYAHEVRHIEFEDFNSCEADEIERKRH